MAKTSVEIIYSDEGLVVVNKPAGVSVTRDRAGAEELVDVLGGRMGAEAAGGLRLIHRLDKDTSGVMVLAKDAGTQGKFSEYFEKRLVSKTYLAIVTGFVHEEGGTIETLIAPAKHNAQVMAVVRKEGKQAVTKWRLLADFGGAALLAVRPLTGRKHQIRVHLPSTGLPLAIDPLYGSGKAVFLSDFKAGYRLGKEQEEKPLIERLTLHAYQLEFPQQASGRPNVFVAALDKKFKAAIKMLTKHNASGRAAFRDAGYYDVIMAGRRLQVDWQ
jgi:RluA family pseudouridine synthase